MLFLLPPSETKRPGGVPGTSLDLAALSFPELTRQRRAAIAGVRRLSRNLTTAVTALGLGPKSAGEALRNRELGVSPLMPAIDRFDGVLYEALDARSLTEAARMFAGRHLVVHSALFGLVGALDPLPAYRLSADSRVPDLPLGAHWREPIAARLASHEGLILDLRSEAYAALGPAPASERSVFLRVVTEGEDGRRRALNHFNKQAKGEFTRRLLVAGLVHGTVDELLAWAADEGMVVSRGSRGELELVV